ncbi:bifunctional UDP-sugar hydrolase/5'-nucleotidase [Paenibacillus sp. JX-17]|uniref:Bifunctional UDP-sugar hydrolase/5'-nucleotidase n=1 Tax=Paenibacillus lacisoli TaxID=3064525 RepID=A0ABT9CGU1_9BACL|nr:bifunctional UDP-sugar hydrolase/5'-nucleotidase [Paenibacillus sp. JX-17]MDO7908480.1 bifunctional UDP-sugar hydrolase/5'-nucleotidase [Paenibacillus sp. JX-17]
MEMNTAPETLTILHTNDIHSHFEHVPSLAAMIEAEKTKAAGPVLVLDIGDHMDRAAVETEGTMGSANVDILNLTGYDAITIGNNEGLTFTPEELQLAYAGIQCPVVCGNFVELSTGKTPSWMSEYAIIDKNGIKIGLLGATAPFSTFYELLGWSTLNPYETLARQVREIRGQVDLIVVMSHLGLSSDQKISSSISGIDVILGAHTHHLLQDPLIAGSTVIGAAGKFGRWLGTMTLEKAGGAASYRLVQGTCLEVVPDLLEENVTAALLTHRQQAEQALSGTIVITDRELPVNTRRESPFGNLLAQAVRHFTGAPASVVNAGQLLGPLPEGDVSKGLLHQLCPSPINTCTMLLTGRELRRTLEESLLPEFTDRAIIGFGFRGKVLGSICVDGIQIKYDENRPSYDKITEITIQGQVVQDEGSYLIGTLDMFTFKVGYEELAKGRDVSLRLPEFLGNLLEEELKRPLALEQCFEQRWMERKE